MYFLSKRGLIITCVLTLLFNCGGNKLPIAEESYTSNFAPRKAYVVIRSEGGPANVQRARDILAADFSQNNVQTQYSLYRAKQSWNQNEIFNTAYEGLYDYIILIDQIAKFTIDNRTQVGAKYQIRSYHIKSENPNWLDLGQVTCNLAIVPSVQKFSREVIRSIVGNQAAFKGHDFEYDGDLTSNGNTADLETESVSVGQKDEIEKLRKELEEEKRRTQLAEQERQRLENQLKLEIEAQKQRAKIAQIEAENTALKKRQRQRELAEKYAAKREEIRQREAREKTNQPEAVDVAATKEEPSREERRTAREEAKKRIAEQKEAKRREVAAAAEAKKAERQRLEELERQERKRLKEELEAERKRKARLAEEDLERIKAKVAEERRQAEELDRQKKEAERLAEQRREEEKIQAKLSEARLKEESRLRQEQAEEQERQERIARRTARQEEAKQVEEAKRIKRLEEKKAAERRLAELELQEKQKSMQEQTSRNSGNSMSKPQFSWTSTNRPNAFIIIQGKKENQQQLENLEDNLEFDFMFAKAKASTVLFQEGRSTELTDVKELFTEDHNIIFLIDQKEYLGDGKYVYHVMVAKKEGDSWSDVFSSQLNLGNRAELKQLSKKITEYLSN